MKTKNSQNNQIKENLVATLQALVADEKLRVEFDEGCENNFFAWNQNLVAGDGGVVLPEPALSPPAKGGWGGNADSSSAQEPRGGTGFVIPVLQQGLSASLLKSRAAADLAACYLLAHDPVAHNVTLSLSKGDSGPDAPITLRQAQGDLTLVEQKFFNEFEKIRVISCVKNTYLGVVKNILHKVESDIFSGSVSLSLILLKEIFGSEVLPRTTEFAAELEENLNKKIVAEIKKLALVAESQSDFALGVARVLELLKNEKDSQEKQEEEEKSPEKPNEKSPEELQNSGAETVETEVENNCFVLML